MSGEVKPPALSPSLLADLYQHAREGYPEEICGLLRGPRGADPDEVVRCVNRQNELHARDPARYPRTAREAYNMGLDDITLLDQSLNGPRPVQVIYHSHVDVGAYYSADDKLLAAPPGWDPLYPGVDYLVIDAQAHGVQGAKLFRCTGDDFIAIAELPGDGPDEARGS